MYYLSFDCANKSLAIGLYNIDSNFNDSIRNIIREYGENPEMDPVQLNHKIDTLIDIIYVDVLDILPSKKVKDVDIIERSSMLKSAIQTVNQIVAEKVSPNEPITVCIEYQMNVNDKSRTVYSQLVYEYSNLDQYTIMIMKPLVKNTIYFAPHLQYGCIVEKYNSIYRANKQHSTLNFLYFIDVFGHHEKIKHIKKKNIDDIADTFMQVIAYLLHTPI